MVKLLFKYSNLVLLLLSVVWLSRAPDWEPLIALLTLLFGYLYQDIRGNKDSSQKEEIREHDKALFLKYEELLPEDNFIFILNNELCNSRVHQIFSGNIYEYLYLSKFEKGKFLQKKLQSKFDIFVKHLRNMKDFMDEHFFVIDRSAELKPEHWVIALYPEMKDSDEDKRRKYFMYQKVLLRFINDVEKAYIPFRQVIKKYLHL